MPNTTQIYDHTDYWKSLQKDVCSAVGSIDIHTPFVTKKSVTKWEFILRERVKAGVQVRVFLQQPRDWHRRDEQDLDHRLAADFRELKSNIAWLQSIGAQVILRPNLHAKFVLLDERILWEGSLNFLSHYDTVEHLRRSDNPAEVKIIRERHGMKFEEKPNSAADNRCIRQLIDSRSKLMGINQHDLSKLVGCGQPQISRLTSGQQSVIHPLFVKILKALGLDVLIVPSYLTGRITELIESECETNREEDVVPVQKLGAHH